AAATELLTALQSGFLEELRGLDPAFDDWLEKERRRLIVLACRSADAYLRETRPGADVIAAARAMLRLDKAHGPAWRALIQAHIDASDRAAARFVWDQWSRVKGFANGHDAPAEMAALLGRIRGEGTSSRADGPPARGDAVGSGVARGPVKVARQ